MESPHARYGQDMRASAIRTNPRRQALAAISDVLMKEYSVGFEGCFKGIAIQEKLK